MAEDIAEGELFTTKNLNVVRPGDGAAPIFLKLALNKKSIRLLKKGTPIKLSNLLGA